MYEAIVKAAVALTNIRGRYAMSAALLDIEVARLAGLRDYAKNYGKSEWTADGQTVNTVELDNGEYKQLVVCLSDGTSQDITDQVSSSLTDLSCPSTDSSGLQVSVKCDIITITSEVPIVAVRALYKKSASESADWIVSDYPQLLTSYLRWQLLADIDARSSGVAYNVYQGLLKVFAKEETI